MYRLALLLALNGCVHIRMNNLYSDFYNPTKHEYLELHQCTLPIPVSIEGLSAEEANKVRDGFRFWEKYAGRSLFVEADPARVVIKANDKLYYGHAGGITSSFWDKEGCYVFSRVVFMYPLASLPEWDQVFIIRHEIGHTIGLDDSDDRFHIMYRFVGMNVQEPDEFEIQALQRYYGQASSTSN